MISVDRIGRLPDRYALRRGRRPLGRLELRPRMSGGVFEVDGVAGEVRPGATRGCYDLLAADGSVQARAERVHRRRCSVRTADGALEIRRGAPTRVEAVTDSGGGEIGRIAVSGRGADGVVADLPGLDVAVQVFVVALVLIRRRRRRRIAFGTAAVSAGTPLVGR